MRSEIALASLLTKNRFELCHQVFKIVRKFHKPGNRLEDTATDALQRLAGVEHKAVQLRQKMQTTRWQSKLGWNSPRLRLRQRHCQQTQWRGRQTSFFASTS